MKKIIKLFVAILLILSVSLSLVACGGEKVLSAEDGQKTIVGLATNTSDMLEKMSKSGKMGVSLEVSSTNTYKKNGEEAKTMNASAKLSGNFFTAKDKFNESEVLFTGSLPSLEEGVNENTEMSMYYKGGYVYNYGKSGVQSSKEKIKVNLDKYIDDLIEENTNFVDILPDLDDLGLVNKEMPKEAQNYMKDLIKTYITINDDMLSYSKKGGKSNYTLTVSTSIEKFAAGAVDLLKDAKALAKKVKEDAAANNAGLKAYLKYSLTLENPTSNETAINLLVAAEMTLIANGSLDSIAEYIIDPIINFFEKTEEFPKKLEVSVTFVVKKGIINELSVAYDVDNIRDIGGFTLQGVTKLSLKIAEQVKITPPEGLDTYN